MTNNTADTNEFPEPDKTKLPRRCQQCGAIMESSQVENSCPACLMRVGFESDDNGESSDSATDHNEALFNEEDSPEVAQLLFPGLEIIERIGQGGMGIVYKARQKHLGRLVALKLLRAKCSGDPSLAERFTREARALAKLSHPNIVGVHDFGQAGDRPFLIMEYVDGVNLRSMLESKSLNPVEAMAMVPAICEALQFAHDEGVVHRDIKPENILVDRRGRVRIADFGLARLMTRSKDEWTLTGTRQVMGTPHYMAPEQIEHPQDVDHRADIYSLGVVIYEMLTGELPIGRFELPSDKINVDIRFDDIVLRTLEKEPIRRYQHVTEVQTAVENIATDSGSTRRTPTSAHASVLTSTTSIDTFLWIAALGVFAAAIVDVGFAIRMFYDFMLTPFFSWDLLLGGAYHMVLAIILGFGGWNILNHGTKKWLWTALLAVAPVHFGILGAWPFGFSYLLLLLIGLRIKTTGESQPKLASEFFPKSQSLNDGLAFARLAILKHGKRSWKWLTKAWPVIWRKASRAVLLASLWFVCCAVASLSLYWFYGRSRFPTILSISDQSASSTILSNSKEIRLSIDSHTGRTHRGYVVQPADLKRTEVQFSLYRAAFHTDLRSRGRIYMSPAFQTHLTASNTIEYETTYPENVVAIEPSAFKSKPIEGANFNGVTGVAGQPLYPNISTVQIQSTARGISGRPQNSYNRLQYRPQLKSAKPIAEWLETSGMTEEQAAQTAAGLYSLISELADTGGLMPDSTGENKLRPIADMLNKELFTPQASAGLFVGLTTQAWVVDVWIETTIAVALLGLISYLALKFVRTSRRRVLS